MGNTESITVGASKANRRTTGAIGCRSFNGQLVQIGLSGNRASAHTDAMSAAQRTTNSRWVCTVTPTRPRGRSAVIITTVKMDPSFQGHTLIIDTTGDENISSAGSFGARDPLVNGATGRGVGSSTARIVHTCGGYEDGVRHRSVDPVAVGVLEGPGQGRAIRSALRRTGVGAAYLVFVSVEVLVSRHAGDELTAAVFTGHDRVGEVTSQPTTTAVLHVVVQIGLATVGMLAVAIVPSAVTGRNRTARGGVGAAAGIRHVRCIEAVVRAASAGQWACVACRALSDIAWAGKKTGRADACDARVIHALPLSGQCRAVIAAGAAMLIVIDDACFAAIKGYMRA